MHSGLLSLLGHPVSAEERLSYVVYVERGIYLRRPRLLVGDESEGLAPEAAATAARPAAAVELLPSSCVAVGPAASVAVDLLRCRLRLQVVVVVVASLQSPVLCYCGRNYSVGSGVGK